MQCRFFGAIALWLKLSDPKDLLPTSDIPYLNHFNFNEITGIFERFKTPIAVTNTSSNLIEVRIPDFYAN